MASRHRQLVSQAAQTADHSKCPGIGASCRLCRLCIFFRRGPTTMPRNRWTLTRSQKSEYSAAVERMRVAGAELAPFAFDCPWVRVTHCLAASCVRAWTGASVFVIHVRMVGLASKIVLQGFE